MANLIYSCKMLAVVVLYSTPREYCIVPEEYIYGLKKLEDQLKTWGVMPTIPHLVYWKRSLLDETIVPVSQNDANFNLAVRTDFPPPPEIDDACYKAQVKRFYSKYSLTIFFAEKQTIYNDFVKCIDETRFEEAKKYCATFRPQARVIHNEARAKNQPVPPNVPFPNDSRIEENDSAETGNVEIAADSNAENTLAMVDNENKPPLVPLEMDEHDTVAMNELIDDDDEIVILSSIENEDDLNNGAKTSTQNSHTDETVSVNNSVQSISDNDNEIVGDAVEADHHVIENIGDMEITYSMGCTFSPKIVTLPMTVKKKDVLSGYMPYRGICDRNDVRFFNMFYRNSIINFFFFFYRK